jgi:hypothetical protein
MAVASLLATLYTGSKDSLPMAGPSPEVVAMRLSSVRCAVCRASDFTIDPRSITPDGNWTGMCVHCRYTFPVHTDMELYQRTQPDLAVLMKTLRCPKCEELGVTLDFRILLSVREAYYFVTCKSCGHPFTEKSFLEAFE